MRSWQIVQTSDFFPRNKKKGDHPPQCKNSEKGVVQWKMLKIDREPPENSKKKRKTMLTYNVIAM